MHFQKSGVLIFLQFQNFFIYFEIFISKNLIKK